MAESLAACDGAAALDLLAGRRAPRRRRAARATAVRKRTARRRMIAGAPAGPAIGVDASTGVVAAWLLNDDAALTDYLVDPLPAVRRRAYRVVRLGTWAAALADADAAWVRWTRRPRWVSRGSPAAVARGVELADDVAAFSDFAGVELVARVDGKPRKRSMRVCGAWRSR